MSQRERSSRFSVYVPSPKVRLNMGPPIYKPEDGTAQFGYTGMSLQSDRHLFIDVNKVALYQSGSHSMWQVGGKWLQYSNANMVMASTASNTVAASAKVVIVAGAGHGQITALDHAQPHVTPRMVDYNNLDLHYRVEEVHNGIKQLMYGDDWQGAQQHPQADQLQEYEGYSDGGMLEALRSQFEDLGHSKLVAKSMLQPLEWEGNYVEMKNGFPPGGDSSVYPALKAFDPYPPAGFRNPGPAKIFGHFLQTVNFFHRFVDVLGKVGPALTDNFVIGRVQNLIAIWGHAQDGFQSALNVGDFARWDQSGGTTGLAFGDESGNVAARHTNAEAFGPSGATLVSRPEYYDLTGLSGDDLKLDVYDRKSGTKRVLTLSLADLPADPVELSIATGHQAVRVSVVDSSAVATFTLAGDTFAWDPTTGAPAPDGFDVDNGLFSRTDNSLFAASAGTNCSVTSVASGSISVDVDGATKTIDLAGLATAANRADFVAAALGSVAAASAGKVTITSAQLGEASKIWVPKTDTEADINAAKLWLGTSKRSNGIKAGSAAWLAAQFASLGMRFDAEAGAPEDNGSDVCTLTHKQTGEKAYIQVSGGPASRLFGEDPAIAQGKDGDWLKNLGDVRVLQYEIAKYPEDVRNMFRPVVEAFKDVMAVYDKIKAIIDELLSIAGLALGPPSSIGMFAGDGITLGTGGKLFAAADGITLIASPTGDPDERKFAMGPVEKWLVKAADWDPLKEYWKNRDAGHPFQVPKKDGHKSGGIRILSSADLFMATKTDLRLTALGTAAVEGAQVHVAAVVDARVASREGRLGLSGKWIAIGEEADDGKQKAAEWVRLNSKTKFEVKTLKAAQVMDNDVVHLGSRGAQAFEVKLDKPRLYISTKAGSEAAHLGTGDAAGLTAHGFKVEAAGDPIVAGKNQVEITAGATGIKVESGGVQVTGQFKVGPEFVVKSSGKLSPATVVASVLAQHPRGLQLPAEYAALMVEAKAIAAAVDTLMASLAAAEKARGAAFMPPARLAADELVNTLNESRTDMRADLADLDVERSRLIAEAQLYDVDDGALGRVEPDDSDVFFG